MAEPETSANPPPPSYEGYKFPAQMEALALPGDLSKPERAREQESYYISAGVDIILRATEAMGISDPVYKRACYTQAIRDLFTQRDDAFDTPDKVKELLLNTARTINGGQEVVLSYEGLPAERKPDLDAAISRFTAELQERLNNPKEYDPVETFALAEYRMHYLGPFYKGTDRSIPEAIGSFILMRNRRRLPEYGNWPLFREARRKLLPGTDDPQQNIAELSRDIAQLREDQRFKEWLDAFHAQFRAPARRPAAAREIPNNPWQVMDSTALDHESTTYDRNHVTRNAEDIDLLRRATGKRPELLVVFKPERMALHEAIAAAVTKIQMEDPIPYLRRFAVDEDGLFQQKILPRVRKEISPERFEHDRKLFDDYVDIALEDHFHTAHPHMEFRDELLKVRQTIIERIQQGKYDPRLAESRAALHHLVADELLRQRYQKLVRNIVDEEIEAYLNDAELKREKLRLPLKPGSGRLAWMTVGGPASGKSTLEQMIVREYEEMVGSTSPLCQINSDHYKPLLLPKKPDDPEHGAKTYWESGQVRQRAVDRLDEMIDQDQAPDFWVSTMTPSPERMKIAGKGGAKVNIYVVSCPVEGENGAVERAHRRASNPDPRNEDYFRFMSTESILENHKQASALLPSALAEARRDLRIYNTATRPTVLIASMDSYNRELRVFDAEAFIAFVRKSFINEKAGAPEQVYAGIDDRKVAAALCEYPKAGVSLNFRYSPPTPNLMLGRIRTMPIPVEEQGMTRQQADQLRQLMLESQPEAYMWVGHDRALIHDFQAFVRAFGDTMAEAMLIELGKRWPLSVRDYIGNELLTVDDKGTIFYPPADDPINRLKDPQLRGIIERAALTLEKEITHEREQQPAATRAGQPSALPAAQAQDPGDRGRERTQSSGQPGGGGQETLPGGPGDQNPGEHAGRSESHGIAHAEGSPEGAQPAGPRDAGAGGEQPPEAVVGDKPSFEEREKQRRQTNKHDKGEEQTLPPP